MVFVIGSLVLVVHSWLFNHCGQSFGHFWCFVEVRLFLLVISPTRACLNVLHIIFDWPMLYVYVCLLHKPGLHRSPNRQVRVAKFNTNYEKIMAAISFSHHLLQHATHGTNANSLREQATCTCKSRTHNSVKVLVCLELWENFAAFNELDASPIVHEYVHVSHFVVSSLLVKSLLSYKRARQHTFCSKSASVSFMPPGARAFNVCHGSVSSTATKEA